MPVVAAPPIEYYYETHPAREDLLGDTPLHTAVVDYLDDVLKWLYHDEGWFIARNYEMYFTRNPNETPISPDLAVFKGVRQPANVEDLPRRWAVGEGNPAPAVVIEIASNKTVARDLEVKPEKYARIGVKEYIFWDPRPSRRPRKRPLRGWRFGTGIAEEMAQNEQGWLWSDELESWVVPEGRYIRLYTRGGSRRLTVEAAERAARERLMALLRSHGIDPDEESE